MNTILRIQAPHFNAEAEIKDGVCVKASPSIRSFRRKALSHIENECSAKKWKVSKYESV